MEQSIMDNVNVERKMSKDKTLKAKAIKVQGKDYVLVSDRVTFFNNEYPNGSINTELVSTFDSDVIVVKATITPDVEKPDRRFTDYAQELVGSSFINKTSAMENASTSAVGRALAYMGIGVLDSIASVDEINKANNRTSGYSKKATPKQIDWMRKEASQVFNIDQEGMGEELDQAIEKVLLVSPQEVPVYDVKNAVDKIRLAGKSEDKDELADVPDGEVTLEDIPY